MEEFEAAVKRRKITETTEKTMYDNSNQTTDKMKKAIGKNIGGKARRKRDLKNKSKTKLENSNNKSNDEAKIAEKLKNLKNYYNQLRVKKGDLKPDKSQRKELIQNCFDIIQNDYKDIIYKHDGCRIVQSMLKNADVEDRTAIINSLMEYFAELITQKYAYHLAMKMVEFCPDDKLHDKMIDKIINRIGRFIMHSYASEVIEALYQNSKVSKKQQMLGAFYGEYFLILAEHKDKTIKELIDEKPNIKEGIVSKLESLTHKLIDKGMTRHTLVQAILYDYISIAGHEELLEMVNLLLEVFPALLKSDKGLQVACGLFAMASSKERRAIVKTLKPLISEMITSQYQNSINFIIYVCLNLDDTVLARKSIVNTLVKSYEDVSDQRPAMVLYSLLLTGLNNPIRNLIHKDTINAMTSMDGNSTSKKDDPVRRKEILSDLSAEICQQTKMTMIEDLMGKTPFIVLSLIQYAIEFDECDEYMQQLYKNLGKEIT